MSVAGGNFCLCCGEEVILTIPHVTEHLQRRHNILASAPVLAANMFVNNQACQEVTIILKEFDQKNAAIDHMEKNKMAMLQILSQKDLRIAALTKELVAIEKLSVSALADSARWNAGEKIVFDQKLKYLKRQGFLTLVKKSKLSAEKIRFSDQKVEEQRKEIHDLKLKNASLVKEIENLKVCVEAQQVQLRSVSKSIGAVKSKVVVERKSLKTKIENLTAELVETKCELQKENRMLEAEQNVVKDLQNQIHEFEAANDFFEKSKQSTQHQLEDLQKQILKLEIDLEKKDKDFQEKWEILIMEKDKVVGNMRQSFDEDRLCFEVKMDLKEKEIEDLRSKLRNASIQVGLIESDLRQHQKNLLEHFQLITKVMQPMLEIRNLNGSSTAVVRSFSERVLQTLVKTLVAEDANVDG